MSYNKNFIFTSESVSEGHPDKICDQISDAVLDLYLSKDHAARVACECLVTTQYLLIAGEIATPVLMDKVEIETVARNVMRDIGYTHTRIGFDADTAKIDIKLHSQSPDIAQGVIGEGLYQEEGAGDQGMMFGFAVNETDAFMPMPIYYAHNILHKLSSIRKKNEIDFLLPDAKSQVSIRYENGKPVAIDTIVVSSQHQDYIEHSVIEEAIIETCIKQVIPASLLQGTKYYINPTGRFVVGGPHGDCGLTGRKIIVDTYGGFGRHGGGAFSGKDPSKVDRSAAYMARYVALNVVASGVADMCEVQIAYAIGVAKPVSVMVNTFGTGKKTDEELSKIIQENFNLTPKGIRETLSLRTISYLPTAAYGHFGRQQEGSFTWEKTDKTHFFK